MSNEYFDTGNDYRVIFSINVLRHAIQLLKSKKIGELRRLDFDSRLSNLLNLLNHVRYSYLPKRDLVELDAFKTLISESHDLYSILMRIYRDLVKNNENAIKWLRFVLRNISSLEERLVSYPDKPSSAVQYYFVKVLSIMKHPQADNLWLTSIADSKEKFDVITNDPTVKSGEILLVAFLPPKEFSGIVSEGMFLGSTEIRRGSENTIGSVPKLNEDEEKKLLAEIYRYIK